MLTFLFLWPPLYLSPTFSFLLFCYFSLSFSLTFFLRSWHNALEEKYLTEAKIMTFHRRSLFSILTNYFQSVNSTICNPHLSLILKITWKSANWKSLPKSTYFPHRMLFNLFHNLSWEKYVARGSYYWRIVTNIYFGLTTWVIMLLF